MFLSVPRAEQYSTFPASGFPEISPLAELGFFALHCLSQRCKGVLAGFVLPALSCTWDSKLGRWKSQILITEYSELEGTDQQGSSGPTLK